MSKPDFIGDVEKFHRTFDVLVATTPGFPSVEDMERRRRLIQEEVVEELLPLLSKYTLPVSRLLHSADMLNDFVEIADGIADSIYVLIGTALELGIPLDRVWKEVQRSNMAKSDPETGEVRRREDGKILKPDGWTPPNILGIFTWKDPKNTPEYRELLHVKHHPLDCGYHVDQYPFECTCGVFDKLPRE